jgi:major membrane immunogen (membrane-anchored lipoprotein)
MRKPPGEHMLCVYLAVWLVYLSPCAAQTLSGYTLLDGTYQVKRRRRGEEGV